MRCPRSDISRADRFSRTRRALLLALPGALLLFWGCGACSSQARRLPESGARKQNEARDQDHRRDPTALDSGRNARFAEDPDSVEITGEGRSGVLDGRNDDIDPPDSEAD